jgi:hypothetical protein
MMPLVLRLFDALAEPGMLLRGPKAVIVGEIWKSMNDPGADVFCTFRPASSWRQDTVRYCFSPDLGFIPSNWAFWPEIQKALTAAETLLMTCAGAAGVCEKNLAPPTRPLPRPYPPPVRQRVPPVRFGRRVEAKGALRVKLLTAAPILDLG